MKKTLYVASSDRIGADGFDLRATFELDEAKNACYSDLIHLTEK